MEIEAPKATRGLSDLRGSEFCNAFALNDLTDLAHDNAKARGFWDDVNLQDPRHILSLLALITTETSEAVEAVRKDDPENLAEEMADQMIRIFDVAGGLGINLGRAVHDKMAKNLGRPFKHGKVC